MKKFIVPLFMIIMLTGCGITPKTPFLGEFADDTPKGLYPIHATTLGRMTPTPGTEIFEFTVLPNGKIAGRVNADGDEAWCTNYAAAVRSALIKAGYREKQIAYGFCSVFDTTKPDHVVVILTLDNGDRKIFDNRMDFVMRPDEYPKTLTPEGIRRGQIAYLWWARFWDADEKEYFISAKL